LKKEKKHTFGSSIDVLTGVHALDGDEILNSLLKSVSVPEDNLGERSSSAGVMDDVLHNSLDVSAATEHGD